MGRFLRLLVPQSLSLFGSSVLQFALIWTIVYAYGSGRMLLLSTLAAFIPQIAVSLLIGPVLDRFSRKVLIAVSDALSALAALLFLALRFCGNAGAAVIIPLIAVRAVCQGVQTPAYDALLPLLAPRGDLVRANGMKGVASSAVMLLSPAAAAFLFPLPYGLEAALLLDVVTAVTAIASISVQRLPAAPGEGRINLRSGFEYCIRNRSLLLLLVLNALVLFSISPGAFMTPLFLSREYGASSYVLSVSEMTYSAGMIAGGIIVSACGGVLGRRREYAFSAAIYGCALLLMGAVHGIHAYLVLNFLIGVSSPFYSALFSSEVQRRTEEGMLGRIMALLSVSNTVSLPLGMVLFGPLADVIPIRAVFMASGLLAVAVSLIMRRA